MVSRNDGAKIDFEAPDLARRIEALSASEIDRLPFGVILLDHQGVIQLYSKTEARQSGYGATPVGQNMFEISRCMASDDFRGRIERAAERGPVDLDIGWSGDFADPSRDLRIRVQSAQRGGVWMFIERDAAPEAAARS